MQGAALGDDGVQTVRYWLYAPGERAWMWDAFRERGVMGLAWGDLGDLAACASKHDVQQRMLEAFPSDGSQRNDILAAWQFAKEMKPGDVVFVKKGRSEIIGRGVVTGEYVYDEEWKQFPHIRKVDWTHTGQWPIDEQLPMKTLTDVTYKQVFVTLMESSFFDSEEAVAIGN